MCVHGKLLYTMHIKCHHVVSGETEMQSSGQLFQAY